MWLTLLNMKMVVSPIGISLSRGPPYSGSMFVFRFFFGILMKQFGSLVDLRFKHSRWKQALQGGWGSRIQSPYYQMQFHVIHLQTKKFFKMYWASLSKHAQNGAALKKTTRSPGFPAFTSPLKGGIFTHGCLRFLLRVLRRKSAKSSNPRRGRRDVGHLGPAARHSRRPASL